MASPAVALFLFRVAPLYVDKPNLLLASLRWLIIATFVCYFCLPGQLLYRTLKERERKKSMRLPGEHL
jgi:hypothetical protein